MNQIKLQERVNALHRQTPIVDGHFDLLYDVVRQRAAGRTKVIQNQYLDKFLAGGMNIIVSSIYIDDMFIPEMALRRALSQVSALYQEIEESEGKIRLCKTYQDIQNTIVEGKLGILLSFEGVEPLYNDLGLLKIFYELGVRLMGITWSRRNYAADGCHFNPMKEGQKGGLTPFGVSLIEEAEKLGMILDVSHINDEGFFDVLKIAKNPIIASHSDCRSLVKVMRNLTDEQIRAIANTSGVIGMNVCNHFVATDFEHATLEDLLDHVDHIKKLVGSKHVGLGFDFCDHIRKYDPFMSETKDKFFDVLKGHEHVKKVSEGLIKRGYTDEEIKDILGQNFMRIYENSL